MRRTLVHEWLEAERVAVICQNAEPPSEEEWQGYMDLLRRLASIEHRVLVYTEIHLTRAQQTELQEATRGPILPRVAVISPSNAVRFVASMFTLLNRNTRFFAPASYAAALSHLALSGQEREVVTRCYQGLMQVVACSGAVRAS